MKNLRLIAARRPSPAKITLQASYLKARDGVTWRRQRAGHRDGEDESVEPWTPWRRGRDSNPRFRFPGTRALQARPFNHSGTSPTVQVHGARGGKSPRRGPHSLAERAGFEPAIPEMGIPVFETGAFNHSATSPSPKIVSKAKMGLPVSQRLPGARIDLSRRRSGLTRSKHRT